MNSRVIQCSTHLTIAKYASDQLIYFLDEIAMELLPAALSRIPNI